MKKSKINVEKTCEAYNKARLQMVGKELPSKDVIKILTSFGISKNLASSMLSVPTLFQSFKRIGKGKGNFKGYRFAYNPIHKSWFENWINRPKDLVAPVLSEDDCISYLKSKNYQIKKLVGFNEDKFAEDNPDLYKKYLVYEFV